MIEIIHQELHVSGKIDYANAENYYQQGLKLIQAQNQFPLVVNLAKLEQGSTLALAVLVRWLLSVHCATPLAWLKVQIFCQLALGMLKLALKPLASSLPLMLMLLRRSLKLIATICPSLDLSF